MCSVCDHVHEYGHLEDLRTSHCRICHRTWTGTSAAHCTVCHEHFTSDTGFDRHKCTLHPSRQVNRKGEPVFHLTERGWSLPLRSPEPLHQTDLPGGNLPPGVTLPGEG